MRRENPKILNDFLNYLTIQNYSLGTIKGYNIDLLIFFNFIIKYLGLEIEAKDINVFTLVNIKREDIIAFITFLNYKRDNCFKTRLRKIAAIKSFYRWLFIKYPTFDALKNPTNKIPWVEPTERLPKYLKLNEVKKLQYVFNMANSKNPIRDNAIIITFLNCGLRLSELINININDIDFDNKTATIIGKGNKERIIFLNTKTINAIKAYLTTRKCLHLEDSLFVSNRNKKFSKRGIEAICEKAFKLADLEKSEYTTHTLRHTFATFIYQKTKDILLVQELLGHSSIISTEIYTHIENEEVRNAINSNPLANFEVSKVNKKVV